MAVLALLKSNPTCAMTLAEWVQKGPDLADAAGCYVEVRIEPKKPGRRQGHGPMTLSTFPEKCNIDQMPEVG